MSIQFEHAINKQSSNFSASSYEFAFQEEDEECKDLFNDLKDHKNAFDVSIDRKDSEGNELNVENIIEDIVDKIDIVEQERDEENNVCSEFYYFQQNFKRQFEDDGQQDEIVHHRRGSIVQKIRDSVELKKIKCCKQSSKQSFQDSTTDTSKLNTTDHSFFDQHKIHDFQLPMKRGYLLKKSPTIFQGFQKRYCTLENFYFNYYQPDNHSKIIGSINLQIVEISIEEIRDKSSNHLLEFKLVPAKSDKIFHFKSCDGNSQILEEWVSAIKQHIEQAQYFLYRYKNCNLIKHFWRYPQISEHKFKQECDTGDIILFKNKRFGSAVQRTLTTSEYDHVALVLKYKCGKIVLFESSIKSGVNLVPWESLFYSNWSNSYEKKLNCRRTQQQKQRFFEFMKSTLGKQFDISTSKLLKSASSRISRFNTQSTCEKEVNQVTNYDVDQFELSGINECKDSYFCSELVAACYQFVRLLPLDSSSDSYWPVDFSEKKKLDFLQKAYLSCEYQIIQSQLPNLYF